MKKSGPRLIVITPGDPDGIGPEIVWKTLKSKKIPKNVRLLCVGAREPFDQLEAPVIEVSQAELVQELPEFPRRKSPFVWLVPAPTHADAAKFLPGYQSGWSIEVACTLVKSSQAHALVTGPISKERLNRGGYPFPGHTEFLAELCKKPSQSPPEVTMMLANDQLRVSLVTTHLGLAKVSAALTQEKIIRATRHTIEHLRRWWGIQKPKVAVAALNPHAGESGLFGREEIEVIEPAVRSLRAELGAQCKLEGPLPADTLFATQSLLPKSKRYDAVVCMYHDQGLIPVKLLDFRRTVNITLGLPILRTSVDHGVAFDIAKKGIADPSSFQSALDLAIEILETKKGSP